MAIAHYENFPVASVLLPRRLRHPVTVIYRFARQADDFADEGNMPSAERLRLLDGFRAELRRIEHGADPQTALFGEISSVIGQYRLPLEPFYDLLDAFTQDVTKQRYRDFDEVIAYCRRSANPVGRLLLHLYDAATPASLECSDAICSSLQLINFLQDIALDWEKGRIYLPQDEMERFGIGEAQIREGKTDGRWREFMLFQIRRAEKMLHSGAPLGNVLQGRTGLEMRMILQGGQRILDKLRQSGGDVFAQRPVLRPADWGLMFCRAALGARNFRKNPS